MIKTIGSRKIYHFPAFLALLFLVIGSHALHPHYHDEISTFSDCEANHVESEHHSHEVAVGILTPGENHSCNICEFLAICSALKTATVQFSVPLYPVQRAVTFYQRFAIPNYWSGFHIRGPPSYSPITSEKNT